VDEINELKRCGMSVQAISELTGYDRKTIRKYLLKPAVPAYRSRPAAVSKLEPFKPYLNERMQAGVWNAQELLRELRERNYAGGYTILLLAAFAIRTPRGSCHKRDLSLKA
jgi:transposase